MYLLTYFKQKNTWHQIKKTYLCFGFQTLLLNVNFGWKSFYIDFSRQIAFLTRCMAMSEMRNAAKSERRWNASVIMARLLARRPPERKKYCTLWRFFPSLLVTQKGHIWKVCITSFPNFQRSKLCFSMTLLSH